MKLKLNLCVLLFFCMLVGCKKEQAQSDFFAMDTFMSVNVIGDNAQDVTTQVVQKVNALDKLLSRTREESDIYSLNQTHKLSRDSEAVAYIEKAVEMAEKTEGYFDPTVASLTDLWQIGTENANLPSDEAIQSTLVSVGYENVIFTENNDIIIENNAEIDLGGIAKGIAADITAEILRENDVSGLLSLAGNIYAVGDNDGEKWKIGIANPDDSTDYIAVAAISDMSIVTTGDYERFFEQDGIRYHHIFDAQTGYPADTDLRSVTILGTSSAECDAYSTAVFAMGLEKGMDFCEKNNIPAIFIADEKKVYISSELLNACDFEIISDEYTLKFLS